jgi:hypothetical protein
VTLKRSHVSQDVRINTALLRLEARLKQERVFMSTKFQCDECGFECVLEIPSDKVNNYAPEDCPSYMGNAFWMEIGVAAQKNAESGGTASNTGNPKC